MLQIEIIELINFKRWVEILNQIFYSNFKQNDHC